MSRALPIVLSAVLVGGVVGAAVLPHSAPADASSKTGVTALSETAITPVSTTSWKVAGLAAGNAYRAKLAADKRAAAARAAAAAAERARAARAAAARASRSRQVVVNNGDPRSIARSMLAARGWSGQFGCLDSLWSKESGWNVYSYNASSGAYGIPQALPGSKMASAGSDWRTNAATQIRWGLDYIASSYGTPCGAWSHSQSYNWY